MIKRIFLFIVMTNLIGLAYSKPSEVIRIFGNNAKPPKNYIEGKVSRGILVEMMKEVGKELGVKFVFDLYPWARAYKNALNGKGGIIGFSKTTERLKLFDYSDVMYYDDMVLVVKKGKEFNFNSVEDLKGKSIGVTRGGRYGDDFVNAVKNKVFHALPLQTQMQKLSMVLEERIDAALLGPGKYGVSAALNKNEHLLKNSDQFVILPKEFKRDPNFLGFAKSMNRGNFLERFNKALKKVKDSGKLAMIIKKYEK